MNKSDEKNDSLYNSKKTAGSSNGDFQAIEHINIKLGQRPVKFYKLVHFEKSKINDYNYLIEKIKLNSTISTRSTISNTSTNQNERKLIIFVKLISGEEITITSENDWKLFFENSNTIKMLLDSKNSLKLEFCYGNTNENELEYPSQETKVKNIIGAYDYVEKDILKLVFTFAMKNDNLKTKIKEEIISNKIKNVESIVNTKYFDIFMKRFFDKTLEKIHTLSLIDNLIQNDEEIDEEELIFNHGQEQELTGGSEQEIPQFKLPQFSEYYKNEEIEVFRSNLLSKNFMEKSSTLAKID